MAMLTYKYASPGLKWYDNYWEDIEQNQDNMTHI